MDLGDSTLSEEICSYFMNNSKYNSIVLYGERKAFLNYLKEQMEKYFHEKKREIEIIVNGEDRDEQIKKEYPGKYLINVGLFLND